MKNSIKNLALASVLFFAFTACHKDEKTNTEPVAETPVTPAPTNTATVGNLKIEFDNTVDSEPLVLGKNYTNPNGETYSVDKFNYYVSNIVLTKNDNSIISIKQLYRIVKQSDDTSRTITLTGIPIGSYKAIKLLLGVDSARNRSGAQTGGLDIAYASDMYWGWNQGYIFLKFEGTSPSSSIPTKTIEYHMGGFSGVNKAQREFVLDFIGTTANVSTAITPTVILQVNVNELFKTPTVVSFATNASVVSPGPKVKEIADNYADMIRFGSIKN